MKKNLLAAFLGAVIFFIWSAVMEVFHDGRQWMKMIEGDYLRES